MEYLIMIFRTRFLSKKRPLIATALFIATCLPSFSYADVDDIRITPVVKAVENSKGSVVNISTHEQVFERSNPFSPFGSDPFFDRFLKFCRKLFVCHFQ